MSVLILSVMMAVGVTIEETVEAHVRRVKLARRRPRRYTFN